MAGQSFASLITSSIDPAFESNFARADAIATKSLSSIRSHADQASRALTQIGSTRISTGSTGALRSTTVSLGEVSTASTRAERSIQSYGSNIRTATRETNSFRSSLAATSVALSAVEGPLGPVTGRLNAFSRAAGSLTGVQIGLAGAAAAVFGIAKLGSEYQNTTSRLRTVTDGQGEFNRAISDTTNIALRTRSSLDTIVDSYVRLKTTGESFGITGARLNGILETTAKAATLSGGTAQSRNAGIYQLNQALGSGILGGDELRSVPENIPAVAKAIADGLGVQIGALKSLGEQGKLTTEVVAAALGRSAASVNAQFAKLPITLSSAAQTFGTQFSSIIGKLDSSVGLTSSLGGAILGIANHLQSVLALAGGLAVAFAAVKVGGIASSITSAISAQIELNSAVASGNATLLTAQGIGAAKSANAAKSAVAEAVAAQQRVRAIEAEVAALERANAAYLAQIPIAQKAAAASSRTASFAEGAAASGQFGGDVSGKTAAARADQAELTRLQNQASGSTQRLGQLQAELAASTNTAAVASNRAAGALENASVSATAAARSTNLLALGFDAVKAAIPFLAITAAVSALFYLATATSKADDAVQEFAGHQNDFYSQITKGNKALADRIGLTSQVQAQAAKEALGTTNDKRVSIRNQILTRLDAASANAAQQGDEAAAKQIANTRVQIAANDNLSQSFSRVADLIARSPKAFTDSMVGRIDSSAKTIGDEFHAYVNATGETVNNLRTLRSAQADAGKPLKPLLDTGNTGLAASRIKLNADISEYDRGTKLIADKKAERQKVIDAQFGVKKESDVPKDAKGYTAATEANAAQTRKELDTFTAGAKARVAATRQANSEQRAANAEALRDARQAFKDEQGVIEQRAQEKLTALDESAPGISRQSYLDQRIAALKDEDAQLNARRATADKLNVSFEASHKAADQIAKDTRAIGVTLSQARNEDETRLNSLNLLAQGRKEEAAVLERLAPLQERIGDAALQELPRLRAQYQQELLINDALASRERITNLIQGSVDNAREAFTTFLTDLPTQGPKAAGNFFKSILAQASRINAQKITESLFAGADDKVRALTDSRSAIIATTGTYTTGLDKAGSAITTFADKAVTAGERLERIAAGGAVGASGGTLGQAAQSFINTNPDLFPTDGEIVVSGVAKGVKLGLSGSPLVGDTVNVSKDIAAISKSLGIKSGGLPGGNQVAGVIGETAITNLASKLGIGLKSGAAAGIANGISSAFSGAQTGSFVNGIDKTLGISKALGLKSSGTGAQLGGAVGGAAFGPIGSIAGSIVGSVVGGLFKKTKFGGSTISGDAYGNLTSNSFGNSAKAQTAATGAASSVISGLQQIASSLGASITGDPGITIGQRHGDYRVNSGGTSLKVKKGATDFDDDAQAAVTYAIQLSLQKGVIAGISEASKRILASGQDLTVALNKATTIESIPKRLLALTDPVKSAVSVLNTEFTNTISILKEAGATSEQFAQAQQLYDLERASAIKDATAQASSSITSLITSLTATSQSPLNKQTVYNNAQTAFSTLKSQVDAGKAVDADALSTAASNFNDASSALNGSDSTRFADFDSILATLKKADALISGTASTGASNLPASPFDDQSVQAIIAGTSGAQVKAIADQTTALLASNDNIVTAVQSLTDMLAAAGVATSPRSALALLNRW